MSLDKVKKVFENMTTTVAWSVCLVKVKNSKRLGTAYATRGISLKPTGATTDFISRISSAYIASDRGNLKKYTMVTDYDGSSEASRIYKLTASNELIVKEYTSLVASFDTPEMDGDPFDFAANAYALKATIKMDGEDKPVILVSMQNPVCVLKNRFLYDAGSFQEIKQKVLNLRPTVDVLMVDNEVYLLTMQGENLFNMERAYKSICNSTVEDICRSNIIGDVEIFRTVATTGFNPRRFVAFDKSRFEQLKDKRTREQMAQVFSLPLDQSGKIDTSSPGAADKLVKVLCRKGMYDPFEQSPVEVSSATKW